MCSNPTGVHTRPVGESEKTSSGVVVVYRSSQCICLSLSLSLASISTSNEPYTKGIHAIHYTPQLEIIPKKSKNRYLLRTPKWRSPKKIILSQVASLTLLHRSWWMTCWDHGDFWMENAWGFLEESSCQDYEPVVKKEVGTLANWKHLKTNIPYPKKFNLTDDYNSIATNSPGPCKFGFQGFWGHQRQPAPGESSPGYMVWLGWRAWQNCGLGGLTPGSKVLLANIFIFHQILHRI